MLTLDAPERRRAITRRGLPEWRLSEAAIIGMEEGLWPTLRGRWGIVEEALRMMPVLKPAVRPMELDEVAEEDKFR